MPPPLLSRASGPGAFQGVFGEEAAAGAVGCSGAVGFVEPFRHVLRFESQRVAEDVGGHGGRGEGDHAAGAVGLLPAVAHGFHGGGLPCPGRAGKRVQTAPAGQDLDGGVLLVREQDRPRTSGRGGDGVDGVPGLQAGRVGGVAGGHDGLFVGKDPGVGEDRPGDRVEDRVPVGGEIGPGVVGGGVPVVVERDRGRLGGRRQGPRSSLCVRRGWPSGCRRRRVRPRRADSTGSRWRVFGRPGP